MLPLNPDSLLDLSLLLVERPSTAAGAAEAETLRLFDECGSSLLRFVASFGLSAEESEDVVQEVFLALLRHLRLERSRRNLNGWLFQVANNLALKQRKRIAKRATAQWDEAAQGPADPAPNPEARLVQRERRQRLKPVLQALPMRDRRCLLLRAEGLRYRDIAIVLDMSLGGVAKSLARSITRLVNADRG